MSCLIPNSNSNKDFYYLDPSYDIGTVSGICLIKIIECYYF